MARDVIEKLQSTIDIIEFWSNGPEVSSLKGALSDLLLETGIDELVANGDKIVTDIAALAKVRHKQLVE